MTYLKQWKIYHCSFFSCISLLNRSLPTYSCNERPASTPITKKEIHSYPYYFGCYVVAIRPYKEGRFFKKEYIFDKTENNGKNIFNPSISSHHDDYLTHVIELMNETEYLYTIDDYY